jgi:hypothetical protein
VCLNFCVQDPALHTELALVFTDAVLAAAAAPRASFAEVVRREDEDEGRVDEMADEPEAMRARLRAFLAASSRYDVPAVLAAMRGTSMWAEQVILHGKTGNHSAALRLLAVNINDTAAALE